MALRQQLTEAIEAAIASGETRHSIAQAADVHYRALTQFLDADRDLRLSNIERLCEYLGMRLTRPRLSRSK